MVDAAANPVNRRMRRVLRERREEEGSERINAESSEIGAQRARRLLGIRIRS
jgi:hypothetical protein